MTKEKIKTTFDHLTDKGRSDLMSRIRSKDTKPEILLRKTLYSDGLRYRKHRSDLPGKPDISISWKESIQRYGLILVWRWWIKL